MRVDPMIIVLAEDDDGHAMLIQRNLERSGIRNELVRLTDGQEALDFLLGDNADASAPSRRNYLLLLDINLPRIDGVEVLRQLKSNPATSSFPVIMLTTTDDPREIERCYQYGCSVYITKPVEYESFVEAVRRLGLFLQIVQVPHAANKGCEAER